MPASASTAANCSTRPCAGQDARPPFISVSQQANVNQQSVTPANPLTRSDNPVLSALGNILWITLGGGLVLFLEYLVAPCCYA